MISPNDFCYTFFKAVDFGLEVSAPLKTVGDGLKYEEVIYDEDKNLYTDLIYPESKDKLPVFFNVHGGGFVAGDKKYRRTFGSDVAKHGFFVLNPNFITCKDKPFPEFIVNLYRAVVFLEENADKYNLDLSRVIVAGDSSGAYSAGILTMALTDKGYADRLGLKGATVVPCASVLLCGLYSLKNMLSKKMIMNLNYKIASCIVGKTVKKPSDVDGFRYKDELSVVDNVRCFPPCFITYSTNDIFCKGEAEILIPRLKELGVSVSEVKSDKMHCWHLLGGEKSVGVMNELFAFIEKIKK